MTRRISYNAERDRIETEFPFDWDLKDYIKSIPGARFDGASKLWHFPTSLARTVVDALRDREFVVDDSVAAMLDGDEEEARGLRVSELHARATMALRSAFGGSLWIVGKIADYRGPSASGHAYFQLVESDDNDEVVAAVQSVAFRDAHTMVSAKLNDEALELENGLEVAVLVDVTIYGRTGKYQVVIQDIDAQWSRRQLAEKREQILDELRKLGVHDQNLSMAMPDAPQRVALLTAADSEAYHDFVTTLSQSGFSFDVIHFDVRVQGESLERSVLQALALVRSHASRFDLCVICRGGGSRTELGWWDNLKVARAVATLPVKVVVGIGHQRDFSVLDYIASSTKTPTAAAELLIERLAEIWNHLHDRGERIPQRSRQAMRAAMTRLQLRATRLDSCAHRAFTAIRTQMETTFPMQLRSAVDRALRREDARLHHVSGIVRPSAVRRLIASHRRRLDENLRRVVRGAERTQREATGQVDERIRRLDRTATRTLRQERERLIQLDRSVRASDPAEVLARGFAIVRGADGRAIRSAGVAAEEPRLSIQFYEGQLQARPDNADNEES